MCIGNRILAAIAAITMLLSFAACGKEPFESVSLTDDVKKTAPVITETIDNNTMTDFAVSLLKATNQSGENTLISPLSVMCALAMTANGAKGDTLSQMEQTLGLPIGELNDTIYTYLSSLPEEDATLHLANSLWFSQSGLFDVNDNFLQTCADYYDAEAFKTAFDDTTVDDINTWVNEHTDGMIEQILDNIPADAMMYLVNALSFDAEWDEMYEETQVAEGVFTTEDGEEQDADMMASSESHYLETDNATGFLKHYKGYDYAFAALLPNEGVTVDELVASLDGDKLTTLLSSPQSGRVIATMPKFESEFSVDLAAILEGMGMPDAFDPEKADFSAMGTSDLGGLFISRVLHKTHIAVTERGTKAGAATAVEMRCGSAFVEEPKTVTLDRPFVYMLVDCETDTPIFIGTMMSLA